MDLILKNARRIGAEQELTDVGIAGGKIAAIVRFRREARAREQHRHAAVDSLKVLDPKRPIREATKFRHSAK